MPRTRTRGGTTRTTPTAVVHAEDGREDEDPLERGVGGRGRGRHRRGRSTLPARHYKNQASVGCGILEVNDSGSFVIG